MKDNCYVGHRQTNYPTLWTQANQLTDQLTIIDRRQGGKRLEYALLFMIYAMNLCLTLQVGYVEAVAGLAWRILLTTGVQTTTGLFIGFFYHREQCQRVGFCR